MQVTKEIYNKLAKLRSGYLDGKGHEILNPRPLAIPSGLKKPPSLQEQIKRVLRVELSHQAEAQEMESFDDSQDFEIEDEFDTEELQTQYELVEEEYPEEIEEPAEPEPPTEGVKEVAVDATKAEEKPVEKPAES